MKLTKIGTVVVVAVALCVVVALAGCQPKVSEEASQSASGATTTPAASGGEWSMDTDCSICHTTEQSSFEGNGAASAHDSTCTTCHNDETSMTDVHANSEGKTPASKLKKTKIDEATCLSCHGSYEDLAAKTANFTGLTDANGTTVNPHEAPNLTESHVMECADCHKIHSDEGADQIATEVCISCHHEEVYECGTCHEG